MKKTLKIIIASISVVVLMTGAFFAGYYVRAVSRSDALNTINWFLEKIKSDYYVDVTDEQLIDAMTYGIEQKLLDNYSCYYTTDEYELIKSAAKGNKNGIGLTLRNADLAITRVSGNSPCDRAGLKVGDKLTAISTDGVNFTEVNSYAEFIAIFSDIDNFVDFYVRALRGEDELTFTLRRETYLEGVVFYADKETGYSFRYDGESTDKLVLLEDNSSKKTNLDDKTAYIRLSGFTGIAGEQFDEIMQLFLECGKTKLILDLRNNGGGYMTTLQQIAAYFVVGETEELPTVLIDYKGDKSQTEYTSSRYNEFNYEDIVVLANDNSASASECLMGAMLDYKTLTYEKLIISVNADGNARTYGKGIMQTTWSGVFGDAVKLTVARVCWPISGSCIQGVGIIAEGENAVTPSTSLLDDFELDRAIAIIGK